MSYDIYVCRFVNGEPVPLDPDIVDEVLAPHVTARDPEHNFLQLTAGADGKADVYLSSESNITISHFGGDEIMNLISELIQRLEAALVLPGGTVIMMGEEAREHLPQTFKDEWSVLVASTGSEITQAIQAS